MSPLASSSNTTSIYVPGPNEVDILIYGYWPSLSFAWVGTITFLLLFILQTWYACKWVGKFRTFHVLMATGCLSELVGYAVRVFSHYKPYNLGAFIASFGMICRAPVYFSAAVVFILNVVTDGFEGSEKVLLLGPKTSLILFITADITSVTIQAVGASFVSYTTFTPPPTFVRYDQANNILIAGMVLQIAAWTVFQWYILFTLHRAYNLSAFRDKMYRSMRWLLWIALLTAFFLQLRACYRLAEAVLGYLRGSATTEPMLAGLEYLPTILTVIVWSIAPPIWFVRKSQVEQISPFDSPEDKQVVVVVGTPTSV